MPLDEFRAHWLSRAEEFRRLNVLVEGAKLIVEMIDGLSAATSGEGDEALSLRSAARLSGYSVEHLARCVRTGKIANAGERNRPRIRRADLPRKAKKSLESGAHSAYDPDADARSLVSIRRT